ncbi:MAG: sulfatase [Bryobacterales bacterium]|nr:sulfatase [Bryobacterales bacterium]
MLNVTLTRRQFALAAALQARRRPNVLFILCDQWRRQTMPGAGDKDLIAPHLARLTREGVEFTRAYVSNPVCTPSRAALQTGRYSHAVSMPWNNRLLPADTGCVAEAFAAAGYKTGYIGKWHLDGDGKPGFVPPGARRRGYQYWAGFNRGHLYFNSVYFRDEDKPIAMAGFEPDAQTDLAIDFLKQNQSSPFFLFVSFGPPHTPRRPPARHAATYKPGSFSLRENVPATYEAEARKGMAGYYGLCTALDENVGRLLATLDSLRLRDDTIVVFTADHGDMLGSQGLEHKGVWFEESAGVPLLMRWPGRLAAGTRQDWLFNNVDMAPTLRGLCGLTALEEAQGEDRSALVLAGGTGTRPESVYVQGRLGTAGEWRMVIRGWDKLVVDRELKVTHLFNLAQDPYEKENLAGDRATVRRQEELLALMRRWIIKAGDRVPYPGRAPAEEQNE